MEVVEKPFGAALQQVVGQIKGFDGGQPPAGVRAVALAARVGGLKVTGKAAGLETVRLGQLAEHPLRVDPGAVDEEDP